MVRRFDFPGDKFHERNKDSLKKSLASQKENMDLLSNCAKKSGFELKKFITNKALEVYFDVYKDGRNICYIYKGWDDPGFRIANIIELDRKSPNFKERFYEIFKICSSHLITMALNERDKEPLSITLEIGIYKNGFNVKVFKEAVGELEEGLEEIRKIL